MSHKSSLVGRYSISMVDNNTHWYYVTKPKHVKSRYVKFYMCTVYKTYKPRSKPKLKLNQNQATVIAVYYT